MSPVPERTAALGLLHEFTAGESLRKHALAVEAAMRAYAKKFGENEDEWGIAGLLHDFDYERYPSFPDHPTKGSEVLAQRGFPEEFRRTILSHVPDMNIPRENPMARALFACDELCGFIMACALVRPAGLTDLKSSSVRKKMKDKAFARGVAREHIVAGAEELGIDLDEHIDFLIAALRSVENELGLRQDPAV